MFGNDLVSGCAIGTEHHAPPAKQNQQFRHDGHAPPVPVFVRQTRLILSFFRPVCGQFWTSGAAFEKERFICFDNTAHLNRLLRDRYCGPLSQDNNVSSLRWTPVSCS